MAVAAAAYSNVAAMNNNDDDIFDSLPVGYRFDPRDDELVVHYLMNKVFNRPIPPNKIVDTDVYKHNPHELFSMQPGYGGDERYFFTPRERKYPNGERPSRMAGDGYWKASGKGKPVFFNGRKVAVKTSLNFFIKMHKKDIKTKWMMKEYNIECAKRGNKKGGRDSKLDTWVLCTIYKKKEKKKDDADEEVSDDVMNVLPIAQQHPSQIWGNDDEKPIMDQSFPLVEVPLTIEDKLSDTFSVEELLAQPCYNMPEFSNSFCDFSVDHVGQCSSSVRIPEGLPWNESRSGVEKGLSSYDY